jgi:hypothetical protein
VVSAEFTPRELALVELTATRVVEMLGADVRAGSRRATAAEVARELGMSAQWVREHGDELGGQRLGSGPRPRWRFDLEAVRTLGLCSAGKQPSPRDASVHADSEAVPPPRRRRLPNGLPPAGLILASRPAGGGG